MTTNQRAALIVEDQPFVGLIASDILNESGFRTLHAADSASAADVLRSEPDIALVIVEAGLQPGRDGIDFAARIANERPELQLLVAAERGSALPAGLPANAQLLLKPFSSSELRELAGACEPA